MAIDIPMNTLLKIEDKRDSSNPIDLNAFSVDGCEWRKPYTLTIPQVEGVRSISVTRTASESNCGQVSTTTLMATGTVLYGDTLSISALPELGYGDPTVMFASGAPKGKVTGNVTLEVVAGELNTHTVTFTNPDYGAWEKSSLTFPYGTTWSVSGNTVTFDSPTLAGAITNSVIANSPTARTLSFGTASYGEWNSTDEVSVYDYFYTTPVIDIDKIGTSGTLTAGMTFSASNSRSPVTFNNTLGGTAGTNSTYSGNHTWTISGTNTAGSSFARTFTTTDHGAQYYYNITNRNEATSVTSNTTFTPTVTRSVHSYTVWYENRKAWVGSLQIYKNGSLAATAGSTSGSFTASYGDTLYATITAGTGYVMPTVNGISTNSASPTTVTGNISVTTTNNGLKTYLVSYPAMPTGVASFKIYSQDQSGNVTTHVSNPTSAGACEVEHGRTVYATATATSGYNSPTVSGVGTSASTGTTITSNLTIGLTAGLAIYTISYPAMPTGVGTFKIYAGGSVKVTNPTAAGSFTVDSGTQVYATATNNLGYNIPLITGVGITSATATTITKNVSITVTTSRLEYTVSFTNPSYGSWASSSLTLPYGTTWSVSGNTVTFTVPDLAGTQTNTATANSPTIRTLSFASAAYGTWDDRTNVKVYDYSYTTPTIDTDKTSGTITAATTFTATNSRANVTFTNTTLGTNGTNSTYSGSHKWMISGTNSAGASFSRTFTTTAHDAQYYYSISRSSSATQATSDITFTPTVTRSVHTYTVSYPATTSIAGISNCLIYKNGSVAVANPSSAGSFTASYGDTVYVNVAAASGYSAPTVTGVGTSSSTATSITKNITIGIAAGLKAPVVNSARSWDYSYMSFNITNPNSVAVNLKAHFLCMSCSGGGDGECINGYYGVQIIAANSTATITYDVLEETGTTMCEDGVDYEFTFENASYSSSPTVTGSLDYTDYEFTVSVPAKPTGVDTFQVYRNGVVEISNPTATTSFMATYDDEICAIATAATGYNAPTITGVSTDKANPTIANSKINIALTAGLIKYYTIYYPKMPTGVASFYVYVDGTMRVLNPTTASNISVPYGSKVYATATAASGYSAPTITGVGTSSATATTITANRSIILKAGSASTPTLSAPVIKSVSGDEDEEGTWVEVYFQNPNSVAVTAHVTFTDPWGSYSTTANIAANGYGTVYSDYGYADTYTTVSVYFSASGYNNSSTTTGGA